jgi:hypothetical protein
VAAAQLQIRAAQDAVNADELDEASRLLRVALGLLPGRAELWALHDCKGDACP